MGGEEQSFATRASRLRSLRGPTRPGATSRRPYLVQLVVAVAVLVLSTLEVHQHRVGPLETHLFHVLNDLPGALYWPVWAVMQLGNLLAVPATAVVAVLTRRFRLAVELLVAGGGAWLAAKVVKQMVDRGRPGELLHDVVLRHSPASGHGYVAGHAATAFALAVVALPYLGVRARVAALVAATLVALARVYVGAHLPLDILGGAALGWAVGSLVHAVAGPPARSSLARARRWRGRRRGVFGRV